MRKSYIALTVLAMAALVSCQENEISYNTLEKGEVGFYLRGAKETKGADDAVATIKGVTLELGSNDSGYNLFLEQTITNLDVIAPETKGTPAYTENLLDLYNKQFNATVVGKNGVVESNGTFVYDNGRAKYVRKYNNELWDNAPLYFYMWMPGALNDAVGVSGLSFASGTIKFDYDGTKLTTAAQQQDLLFSARYFTGRGTGADEYDEKEGADALFHHALTGVKFASNNDASEDKRIKITEVIINGIMDSGHCEITPVAEKGKYSDDPATYSSASTTKWSGLDASEGSSYSSGTYGAPLDYTSGENDPFGSSFYNAGATRNLNDEDATQTFWIIPQKISDAVTLTLKYTIDDKPYEWTFDFGKVLSKKANTQVEFKAGELYTFYLRIDEVNVKIEDKVDVAEKTTQEVIDSVTGDTAEVDSYYGSTKTNVTITNTGNTDAFIRAAIIGQWLDANGNPVFGFTDYTHEIALVDSWYQDQFVTKKHEHGEFEGLVGYDSDYSGNWVLGSDGYYYYTQVVPAGQPIPSTDPLFTKYTVKECPAVSIAGAIKNVYFVLEIATQAISAKKIDGSTWATYTDAWNNAKAQEE